MRRILEGSFIWRALTASARWLDRQWEKSAVSRPLRALPEGRSAGGLIGRAVRGLHMALCRVFEALRLDKLTEGSVLTRSFFWMALAAFLAPIAPTMAVLGLELISFASLAVTFGRDRDRRFVSSPISKWIVIYAAVEMGSTVLSADLAGSFKGGLLTTAFVLFPLVVIDLCRTERDIERLMSVLAAGGAVVALLGLAQAALGVESTLTWIDEVDFSNITLRVYSTLENPNVLSEYLLLVLPIAATGIYTARTRKGRLMSAAGTAAMAVCLILTWSRGGWLGLALGAAVFLVIMDRRFIVLGLVGLGALLAVMPESLVTRLTSIGDMGDSSTSYRVYIWMATVNMLHDYWLCGFGPGTAAFNKIYPRYAFNAVAAPHSHNLYLQVMCESGLMGIAALLGTVCSTALTLARTIASGDKRTKVRAAALMASGVGFLAQSMTDYSFYNYRVTLMFWIIVGLSGALAAVTVREAKK